jgi:hypothetical protein
MACPVLVDLRNIYRAEEIARHGFVYESIGRASPRTRRPLTRPVAKTIVAVARSGERDPDRILQLDGVDS